MKNSGLVGWCAIVALLLGHVSKNSWAEEAPPNAATDEIAAKSTATTCRCEGDFGASVQQIKRALAGPLKSGGLDFTEEPLDNVVNFLQSEYGIPIQIDDLALEDAGLTPDKPVTVNLQHISLNAALRLMLKKLQLTHVIQDEVLLITTPEEADASWIACVYDVRDLVGRDRDNREINALANVIASSVAAESWAINKGGIGQIKPLRPGLLVVSQTPAVQNEIAKLLELIRATIRQPVQQPSEESMGMGMRGGRGGYGLGYGDGGMEGGYGRGRGESEGRGGELQPEPTPANEDLFD